MSSHQLPLLGHPSRQPRRMSTLPFSISSDDNTAISNSSSRSSCEDGSSDSSLDVSSKKRRTTTIEGKLQNDITHKALCKKAQMENDAMVYLDGPQIYTCGECRTHLTSHDDIISKSFHGRHGRAYLFDQCVNVVNGPAEDRILITGLHSVCDIFCKRCNTKVGWTYARAYEPSQKYKEGKFIIEKIHLHLEESDYYDVDRPAGERADKWRRRSMSWGSDRSLSLGSYGDSYSRSGSISGCSYSSSVGCPQTPPTGRKHHYHGSSTAPSLSPSSPGHIIYEYQSTN